MEEGLERILEHSKDDGLHAISFLDEASVSVSCTSHSLDQGVTDRRPNAESKDPVGLGVLGHKGDDRVDVGDLSIGEDKDLASQRGWFLEDELKGSLQLGSSKIRVDI